MFHPAEEEIEPAAACNVTFNVNLYVFFCVTFDVTFDEPFNFTVDVIFYITF